MKRRLFSCLMVLILLALLVGPASGQTDEKPYRVYLPQVSRSASTPCVRVVATGEVQCGEPLPLCKGYRCWRWKK